MSKERDHRGVTAGQQHEQARGSAAAARKALRALLDRAQLVDRVGRLDDAVEAVRRQRR